MAASDLERLRIKVGWGLRNPGFTWVERLELLETTSKFRTSHEISSSYVHFLHKTWQKENNVFFANERWVKKCITKRDFLGELQAPLKFLGGRLGLAQTDLDSWIDHHGTVLVQR